MSTPDREDIHLISRHAQWPASSARKALEEHVHPGRKDWKQFLELFLIGTGVAFTLAGIIFFFAYNWDSLHKFVKIGLIEGLIVACTLVIVFSQLNKTLKNILLTAAAVLVGVLLAVFGQVYQSGADAYDLFLMWTIAIIIWVLIAHFAPLWLVFITLINTTVFLYADQVANNWPKMSPFMISFFINSGFVLAGVILGRLRPSAKPPEWLMIVVALGAIVMASTGLIAGKLMSRFNFDSLLGIGDPNFVALLIGSLVLYAAGLWYGFKQRKLFYLGAVPFSAIVVVSAFILIDADNDIVFLLITLFVIIATTLLIRWLINIQKNITHEKAA
ncbi:DUF2157 domain-containing protein [Paraflavitalea sp. CAU 1676]|uniref:DUF2157 domain-containing protein n=1 Tax=Paraflavitalea sp. CAU 1676 TaxID=3032598 RepID=UPI0023DA1E30|nr:DUF2157 domain-containing protein [Paraflavitalea sp. CAU 1676]MDF2188628.1 DUF2157 domain-containing protein [Paraflavitalea sp. CAU 1676]